MGLLALATCSSASAQEADFVRDVANRINRERASQRLSRLTYDKTLERAAQDHAEWMARNRRMEHLQPPPASLQEHKTCSHHPVNRAINTGYLAWDDVFVIENRATGQVVHARPDADGHVGEIIAAGWHAGHPATQPATIVAGWMNSPGHRKEILTSHYEQIGIGTACNGNDTFWCVMFGRPKR